MRSKADQLEYERQKKIASDFRWCVENDFQVYWMPDNFDANGRGVPPFRVHIRRKGITTRGKDSIMVGDVEIKSNVTIGNKEYKTVNEVCEAMDEVRTKLRERYG